MPRPHPYKPAVADRAGRHHSEVSRDEAALIWAEVKANPANGGIGLTWTEAEKAFGLKDTNGMSAYNPVLKYNLNGKNRKMNAEAKAAAEKAAQPATAPNA